MSNIHDIDGRPVESGETEGASVAFELLLQGKWRPQMLSVMCSGPIRLGQLARLIPSASKKVLTQNLRRLEANGIVIRTDLSDVVLHVEYDLNPELRGSICHLLNQLGAWGDQYLRWSLAHSKSVGWHHDASPANAVIPLPENVKPVRQSEPEPPARRQIALRGDTAVIGGTEHVRLSAGDSVTMLSPLENPPVPSANLSAATRARQRRR